MDKNEFKTKVDDVLDQLKKRIGEMEEKAVDISEDAKEEFSKQLDNLKDLQCQLASKMEEFEATNAPKWEVIKESAMKFFGDVKTSWAENFSNVNEMFRKNNMKQSTKEEYPDAFADEIPETPKNDIPYTN